MEPATYYYDPHGNGNCSEEKLTLHQIQSAIDSGRLPETLYVSQDGIHGWINLETQLIREDILPKTETPSRPPLSENEKVQNVVHILAYLALVVGSFAGVVALFAFLSRSQDPGISKASSLIFAAASLSFCWKTLLLSLLLFVTHQILTQLQKIVTHLQSTPEPKD